jgi:methionyl-tRNA synthetase
MSSARTFYVTTPIYYVNDLPHIGHTYTTVVADAFARFRRLCGDDVYFLTGTDEHGQKIERAARQRGMEPIALADQVVENYHRVWPQIAISHDDFIRTSEDRHRAGVEELFDRIRSREPEAIYKGSYRGWYCTGCEAFFPESQLVDGRCPEQGHPVEEVEEESYFFRLSAFQQRLLDLYEKHPEFVRPETRLNEVRAFVAAGLRDLSISRTSIRWGIPFPGDPAHVVYVWFDALTNYLSALGLGGGDTELLRRYWTEREGPVVHLVGKDILRFHAVYWPAFLMAAGVPLPTTIYGHGWWLMDESKMSKSRGNIVRPGPLLDAVGPDAVRYFLLREVTLGLDGSYSDEALIERSNADLANDLGNLASRVLSLIRKHTDGKVPPPGDFRDETLDQVTERAWREYFERFTDLDPAGALKAAWELVGELNRFVDRHRPWKLAKDPAAREHLEGVLATGWDRLARLALLIFPAMPGAGQALWEQLGLAGGLGALHGADLEATLGFVPGPDSPPVTPGTTVVPRPPGGLGPARSLFPRLDAKTVLAQLAGEPESSGDDRKEKTVTDKGDASKKDEGLISIDHFFTVELRTARVVECEKVEGADKLLRLVVDVGDTKRQIVAGIAKVYAPEELVGRNIVVVANLQPAKLRGLVSEGMLLAADAEAGPQVIEVPEGIAPGTRVR